MDKTIIQNKRRVKHGRNNFIGYFPSIKKGRMIAFESLLERDLIYLLDFEPHVLDYEEQPFNVVLNLAGHRRRYTPDFLLHTPNLTTLIEVKPERFARLPDNERKFAAAAYYCNKRGWKFQILNESDIRCGYRLINVKTLTQYARSPSNLRLESRILSTLPTKLPGISIKVMLDIFSEDSRNEVITTLFRLAFFNRVHLALDDAPLTLESQISVAVYDSPYLGVSIKGSAQRE